MENNEIRESVDWSIKDSSTPAKEFDSVKITWLVVAIVGLVLIGFLWMVKIFGGNITL